METRMTKKVAVELPDNNPKTVFGMKKPPLGLIPSPALIHMSLAMALGAEKYGAYNWREKGVSSMVYLHAAERHLRSWLDGEEVDPESGASHLGHVMACCGILLDAQAIGNIIDTRPVPAPFADLVKLYTKKDA
jgi:hypothetical protein